jgi:epoxyqueuosine reductase
MQSIRHLTVENICCAESLGELVENVSKQRAHSLTHIVKEGALEAGFAAVGIANPDTLENLPHGWVGHVRNLQYPNEVLPTVKSVIILAFHVWDKIFHLNVTAPSSVSMVPSSPFDPFHGYFLTNEIMKNKASKIIGLLQREGYDAVHSVGIALKTIAVQCGLGWQGKNTLLITPSHGPRVNLIAILTDAELEPDLPLAENLCGECERCLKACPAKALSAYKCSIHRCIVYSLECPADPEVPSDVRQLEEKLTPRPTRHSYLECSICMDVCPYGKAKKSTSTEACSNNLDCYFRPVVV